MTLVNRLCCVYRCHPVSGLFRRPWNINHSTSTFSNGRAISGRYSKAMMASNKNLLCHWYIIVLYNHSDFCFCITLVFRRVSFCFVVTSRNFFIATFLVGKESYHHKPRPCIFFQEHGMLVAALIWCPMAQWLMPVSRVASGKRPSFCLVHLEMLVGIQFDRCSGDVWFCTTLTVRQNE